MWQKVKASGQLASEPALRHAPFWFKFIIKQAFIAYIVCK
jgi:hypothetical protein